MRHIGEGRGGSAASRDGWCSGGLQPQNGGYAYPLLCVALSWSCAAPAVRGCIFGKAVSVWDCVGCRLSFRCLKVARKTGLGLPQNAQNRFAIRPRERGEDIVFI